MQALRRAAELGWSEAWLTDHERYFESLRSRADYQELLAAVRAKNAATAAKLKPRLSGRLDRREGAARAATARAVEGFEHDGDRLGNLVKAKTVQVRLVIGGYSSVLGRPVRLDGGCLQQSQA